MSDLIIRFLSPRRTSEKTSLSTRHQRRLEGLGKFPKPVRLGEGPNGRIAYVEAEIDAWLRDRLAGRDGKAG